MRYRVIRSDEAIEEIRRLSPDPRQRTHRAIRQLANGPHIPESQKLEGHDNLWRVRLGKRWRMVFELDEAERLIRITRVRRRRFAYLGLEQPPR